jgi:hypothetical protein
VVGEAKARYDSPEAMSIPWLLLRAKSNTGTGAFGRTASILRLDTKGGTPPTALCGEQNAHTLARVPYTATYYFYASAP